MNVNQHDADIAAMHEQNRRRERPTYSDLIDRLLAVMTRTAGEQSSVRLTRNAQGKTQIEVLVRTGEHGLDSIDQVRIEAARQYDLLRVKYPDTTPGAAE